MKDKYLVIKKDGSIIEPEKYLKSEKCSEDFAWFVRREGLKQDLGFKAPEIEGKSEYLYYANKMGFDWEQNSDAGLVSYDYKANLIKRLVCEYARQLVDDVGLPIYEVSGSNIFNMSYPVVQAYAGLYGDRLFQYELGKKKLVMSYDASYPQFNLAGKYQLSYKQLPFAHFSVSDCYRYEQSGECMLLYRQRRFYMPDLHPYFKDINEAFKWYPRIEKQLLKAARAVNRKYQVVVEVSSEKNWKQYKKQIVEIAKNLNQDILVGIIMDGQDRYWIINVDYKVIDKFGQSREICCIQVDVGNAKRLGIEYVDKRGSRINPVIIHSAVPGGIERYIYMIFDDFKKCFPLWLYPIQLRLIPVSRKYVSFCKSLVKKYEDHPVRIDIDDSNEGVSKKLKNAHKELIPHSIVIGPKEVKLKSNLAGLEKLVKRVINNSKNKPFVPRKIPVLLSKRVN